MLKHAITSALAAGLAVGALSAPANAQVNGIATVDASLAIAGSTALNTGFQQIGTTYESQRTYLQTLDEQRQTLLQTLDTNSDNNVDDAEADANPSVFAQVQTMSQQIAETQAPMQLAQLYVVNQVSGQYSNAVQQVVSDRNVQFLIAPEALNFAADGANITGPVVEALNARLPAVSITPPDGWQPTQADAALLQEVIQVRMLIAMQQQQAAAAGADGSQQPAVSGR